MRSIPYRFRPPLGAMLLLLAVSPGQASEEPIQLLANAVKNGALETVEAMLAKGANPNQKVPGADLGYSPLALAVQANHPAITRALLKAGADPAAEDENGDTVMTMAADPEHLAVAKVLIEHGLSIDMRNKAGTTTLARVAGYAEEQDIRTILELGANPDLADNEGNTPLMLAAGNDNLAAAELLIKAGAKVDSKNKEGLSALQLIFTKDGFTEEKENDPKLVKLLLDHGADINQRDSEQKTLLMRAVDSYELKYKSIEVLLAAKPDLTAKDKDGRDVLFLAVLENDPKLPAQRFLELGADIKTVDNDNEDLLMAATRQADPELVRLFLDRGLSPTHRSKGGQSAVHYAAGNRRFGNTGGQRDSAASKAVEILKLLEARGGSLTDANSDGLTPLHWAALAGNSGVVTHLLPHYPSLELPDKEGDTPLHLAAASGGLAVVELIAPACKEIDVRNAAGDTPLILASADSDDDTVLYLAKAGADLNALDKQGKTPLAAALARNDVKHARFLMEHGADGKSVADPEAELLRVVRLFHISPFPPSDYVYLTELCAGLARDINRRDTEGMTALMWVAASGNPDALEGLLKHKPDLNLRSADGRTALMWAASTMAEASMEALRKKKADDTLKDSTGRSAADWLEWSRTVKAHSQVDIPAGEPSLRERLAERPALAAYLQLGGWNASDRLFGTAPLHLAAAIGDRDAIGTLLKRGAPADQMIHDRSTPLMEAATNGQQEAVEFLIEHGANPSLRDENRSRAIDRAVSHGHAAIARLLLGQKDSLAPDETSLLTRLVQTGNRDLLHVFLEKGASIPPKGKRNDESPGREIMSYSPLSVAAASASSGLLEELVEFPSATGADEPAYLVTALHVAAGEGILDNVRFLIERQKVDPNILRDEPGGGVVSYSSSSNTKKTIDGFSPLSIALENGHTDVVRYLLEHGAIVTGRTRNGGPPLSFVIENEQHDLLELFLGKNPELEFVDFNGDTALHVAAIRDDDAAIRLLLDAGAARDAKNSRGQTPLDAATAKKATKAIAILSSSGD